MLKAFGNFDGDVWSRECGLEMRVVDLATGEIIGDAGKTHQHFKEECDINEIVRRFGLTGKLPEDFRPPVSGDFTGVVDFHTAMNAVRGAQEAFMAMPAELRARFGNDPQRLMDFVEDGKNYDEALKLGIVAKPAEVPRDAVKAIDELAVAVRGVPKPASGEATK